MKTLKKYKHLKSNIAVIPYEVHISIKYFPVNKIHFRKTLQQTSTGQIPTSYIRQNVFLHNTKSVAIHRHRHQQRSQSHKLLCKIQFHMILFTSYFVHVYSSFASLTKAPSIAITSRWVSSRQITRVKTGKRTFSFKNPVYDDDQ